MENKEKEQSKKRDFLLPGSILIAALLVSISLVYNAGKKNNDNLTANIAGDANQNKPKSANIIIKPVGDTDHVYGNPSAPVKIVEFSDLECPWCKNFHSVLKQTVAAYGGKVAWVYRHFPIDQLHPKARKEAEASECANELGGNDKFWSYIDRLFEITPSNNGLDANLLPQIAADIGLNKNEFETEYHRHQDRSRTASAGMFKGGLADAGRETTKLHTAAHLMLAALRKVLGDHVVQKGSNITPERLRLDFSHKEKVAPEELEKVEDLVNEQIKKNLPVECEEMSPDEAKKSGAMGVFDERYGSKVKVYSMAPFSREICGGPHVKSTSELGHFEITKEESSSGGTRRIKAVLK